jgi:hypothetical protein
VGEVLVRRSVECVPVRDLRTRFRCARVGVSRPDDLIHLRGRRKRKRKRKRS